MSDNEQISKFMEITGSDEATAGFYISSSNGNLENAVSNFLNNDDAAVEEEFVPEPAATPAVPQLPTSSTVANGGPARGGQSTSSGFGSSFGRSSTKPKINTLSSISRAAAAPDDDDHQAFYAGGSRTSGQQVLGPSKRNDMRNHLNELLRQAHEHAHQHNDDDDDEDEDDEEYTPGQRNASANPWGQGVRLGMTDDDHAVVEPANSASAAAPRRSRVVLRLWRQGFTVDDGELRPYDDPANKEFLEAVMRGQIPDELVSLGQRLVHIDVDDIRGQDYKPKRQPASFRGAGQALGSVAPNVIEEQAAPAAAPATTTSQVTLSTGVDAESKARSELNVDTASPVTTLQIRLANGSRLIGEFNLSHTIGDIRRYVQSARPEYAEREFLLVSSFPTRELNNDTDTIEAAGLKNAAIMQRLK